MERSSFALDRFFVMSWFQSLALNARPPHPATLILPSRWSLSSLMSGVHHQLTRSTNWSGHPAQLALRPCCSPDQQLHFPSDDSSGGSISSVSSSPGSHDRTPRRETREWGVSLVAGGITNIRVVLLEHTTCSRYSLHSPIPVWHQIAQ